MMNKTYLWVTAVSLLLQTSTWAQNQLTKAATFGNTNGVDLFFSSPISPTDVATLSNFAISNETQAVAISAAQLVEPNRVRLTAPLPEGFVYTVTAHNLPGVVDGVVTTNRLSFIQAEGYLTREFFNGTRGGLYEVVLDPAAYIDGTLSKTDFIDTFRILDGDFPDATSNYGSRIQGYLNPLVSGLYVFRVDSDDQFVFYISTDDQPANKQMIMGIPDTLVPAYAVVPLVAGKRYYVEALWKAGGMPNVLHVAIDAPGDVPTDEIHTDDPTNIDKADNLLLNPVASKTALFSRFGYRLGPLAFTQRPVSQQASYNSSVEFVSAVEGALPHRFQWYRDGVPIDGATNAVYRVENAQVADDEVEFHVVASNEFSTVSSEPVALTVRGGTVPPLTITSQGASVLVSWSAEGIGSLLESSETLDPNSWTAINESVDKISMEFPADGKRFFRLRSL